MLTFPQPNNFPERVSANDVWEASSSLVTGSFFGSPVTRTGTALEREAGGERRKYEKKT